MLRFCVNFNILHISGSWKCLVNFVRNICFKFNLVKASFLLPTFFTCTYQLKNIAIIRCMRGNSFFYIPDNLLTWIFNYYFNGQSSLCRVYEIPNQVVIEVNKTKLNNYFHYFNYQLNIKLNIFNILINLYIFYTANAL